MIAVQLYSLREEIQKYGFEEVARQIKLAGFDAVETAGFYDIGYEGVKKILDENSLKVCGTHTGLASIEKDFDENVKIHRALGTENIIIPWASAEDFKKPDAALAKRINEVALKLKEKGLFLGYHNHAHELEGKDYLTELYDNAPALYAELDIFWLNVGKDDVKKRIGSLNKRITALHIKELSKDGAQAFNPKLGEGVADLKNAIGCAKAAGVEIFILEVEKFDCSYTEYLQDAVKFLRKYAE